MQVMNFMENEKMLVFSVMHDKIVCIKEVYSLCQHYKTLHKDEFDVWK